MSRVRQARGRRLVYGEQSRLADVEKRTRSIDGAEGDRDLKRGAARGAGSGPK
jgi:hypothetical protein